MIHGFGGHYRLYRLAAALDRLHALPQHSKMSLAKASHLLGVSEARLRALIRRYAAAGAIDDNLVSVATLRHVIRQAREARRG